MKIMFYTVREVANKLRVHPSTVKRWILRGSLDAVALPGKGIRQRFIVRTYSVDSLLGDKNV